MLRSIGAVLAGLVLIVVLSTATDMLLHGTGGFPPAGQPMSGPLFLVALGYRVAYGIAGGYVTARLAPDRPVRHALVLGAIGLVVGAIGTVAIWNSGPEFGPKWYSIAVALTAPPCTWIGGRLRTDGGEP